MRAAVHIGLVIAALMAAACGQPTSAGESAPSGAPSAASAPPRHPLDPLTQDEIRLAVTIARGDPRLTSAAFPMMPSASRPRHSFAAGRRASLSHVMRR